MKKITTLCFAYLTIFLSSFSQEPTITSFYSPKEIKKNKPDLEVPGKLTTILNGNGEEIGLILIYEKNQKKVFMSFILYNGLVKAGSRNQLEMERVLKETFIERMYPEKVKICKRIYSREEETGEKFFIGLIFKR